MNSRPVDLSSAPHTLPPISGSIVTLTRSFSSVTLAHDWVVADAVEPS